MPETKTSPVADTSAESAQQDSELRYLLSAYLFDSLSEEGRLEVEKQLENSEACREELEELRETLSLLSDALDPEVATEGGYSFEEKRLERVLAASQKRSPLRLLPRPALLSAAAGILLFIGIAIAFVGTTIKSTAPGDSLARYYADSESPVTGTTESLAEDEGLRFRRALLPEEKSAADQSVSRKPRALVPKTINDQATPPPPVPASREKNVGKRREGAVVLLDPADPSAPPGRTGSSAPASDTLPIKEKKASSGPEAPPSGKVIDAIGVGGGAAGAYGVRYGKARLVRSGEKQETGEGLAAKAAETAKKRPPLSNDRRSFKNIEKKILSQAQQEVVAANEEDEAFEEPPREAPHRQKDQEKLNKTTQRARLPLVKRKILPERGRDGLEAKGTTKLLQKLGKVGDLKEMAKKEEAEEIELVVGDEFSDDASFADTQAKRPLLNQLSQSLQKADRGGQLDFRRNDWAYNLNIEETPEGYLSAGKGAPARQQGDFSLEGQTAEGGPVEINEKALNSYAWYQRLDPNLSYEQFNSRALTIPAPSLGDEGLGEKGFREKYGVNPFVATNRDHLSTFGMDVDNASWGRTLETIRNRELPPPQTVRVEEFINNFPDPRPGDPGKVFTVYTEGGPAPFGDHSLELIKVTIKSRELRQGERRDAILTFAVDTSGSMANKGKLRLLKDSIRTLVSNLSINDRVAIVAFSTNAYVVLPHTSVRQKTEIDAAIDSLQANGGTNVEAGIDLAYRLAAESGNRRAANRVILCSDGVANLGARGPEVVLKRNRRYARDNLVSLFTYAFGTGGRQAVRGDRMLQRLADEGDGRYQYVDSASTSRDIFSLPDQLQILASDAKIQVDFNPEVVSHYRLLGYEKRDIADKDFRNDKVDAGEVGPGATVTALYEIKRSRPVGSLGTIRLRYLDTISGRVEETDFDLPPGILSEKLADTSDRFRLIASVAEFAELLRGSYYARNGSYGAILELMSQFPPEAKNRIEFAEIYKTVGKAQGLGAVRTLQNIQE